MLHSVRYLILTLHQNVRRRTDGCRENWKRVAAHLYVRLASFHSLQQMVAQLSQLSLALGLSGAGETNQGFRCSTHLPGDLQYQENRENSGSRYLCKNDRCHIAGGPAVLEVLYRKLGKAKGQALPQDGRGEHLKLLRGPRGAEQG